MSFWLAVLQDKHIKSCIEKNVRVLVIENTSGMQLAQIMKQTLAIEEVLCHYPRFDCPDLEGIRATSVKDFEAVYRKDWDKVKGEDKRQLVIKFLSEADLQEMIKVIKTS
jgi:hypothetical protein